MRIIHVSAYYAPAFVYGGPPRSIHGLCGALRLHGAGVEVFTTDANGPQALPPDVTDAGEYDGVPVRYFPRTAPLEPIGSRALESALRQALPTVDLVHVHGLWNRVVWGAVRECLRAGVPYVLSPRGMLEQPAVSHHRWRKRVAFALFERRTIEHASLIHATSPLEQDTIRTWQPDASTVVIPNGVSLRAQGRVIGRSDLGVPADRTLVLFVGRLHAIKRVDLLLDAFSILHAARPDTQLVIAGPDERRLQAGLAARHPGLRDAVSWLGEVTAAQRDALLHHSRALVLCSDSESFGVAVLEALAAARPAVVTDTCGWSELTGAQAGIVVPQSPEAMAAAMRRLVDDAALAARMGERGRALVESAFTWDVVAARMAAAYEGVVARSRAETAC